MLPEAPHTKRPGVNDWHIGTNKLDFVMYQKPSGQLGFGLIIQAAPLVSQMIIVDSGTGTEFHISRSQTASILRPR